jgi:YesN/AraC family two-component response regulator
MLNPEAYNETQMIVDLVSDCTQIPIRFYDEINGQIYMCNISQEFKCNFRDDSLLLAAYIDDHQANEPIMRFSEFGEIYAALPVVNENDVLAGVYIIGPGIIRNFGEDELLQMYKQKKITIADQNKYIKQRDRLTLVSDWQIRSVLQLINLLVSGKNTAILSVRHINEELKSAADLNNIQVQFAQKMNDKKTIKYFHTTNGFEKAMLRYVREGSVERLYELINNSPVGNTGKLAKNLLRHHKNQFIVSTALACRAAIEGGMNSENAYTLSDIYLQNVEECQTILETLNMGREMLFDYARAVARIKKQKDSYTKPVRDVIEYIYLHLQDKLELKSIATALNYSPNYLGQVFRNNTGQKISEFVTSCRIDEARQLLKTTNTTINEISNMTGFGSASYFCTIFKNNTGLTPEQYRNNK